MRIESFAPVETKDSQLLIVGTMPSTESLRKGEYYGHPTNHFWDIIYRILKTDWDFFKPVQESESYDNKLKLLHENKIALWDTLKYCNRKGNLDKDIRNEIKNDFNSFFLEHTEIKKVLFNGKKAYKFFTESFSYIMEENKIKTHTMNSTSSTNPNNTFEILNEWKNEIRI